MFVGTYIKFQDNVSEILQNYGEFRVSFLVYYI